jgi:hypothetical protein
MYPHTEYYNPLIWMGYKILYISHRVVHEIAKIEGGTFQRRKLIFLEGFILNPRTCSPTLKIILTDMGNSSLSVVNGTVSH